MKMSFCLEQVKEFESLKDTPSLQQLEPKYSMDSLFIRDNVEWTSTYIQEAGIQGNIKAMCSHLWLFSNGTVSQCATPPQHRGLSDAPGI